MTAWEFTCYDVAESAAELIEAEELEKLSEEAKNNQNNNPGGKGLLLGELGKEEKGGAFSHW